MLEKGVVENCWRRVLYKNVAEECCQLIEQHESCLPFVTEDIATGSAWMTMGSNFFVFSWICNSGLNTIQVWWWCLSESCCCGCSLGVLLRHTQARQKKGQPLRIQIQVRVLFKCFCRVDGVWVGTQVRLPCAQPRTKTNMGLKLQCWLHKMDHNKAKTTTEGPNVETKEATLKEYAFHVGSFLT